MNDPHDDAIDALLRRNFERAVAEDGFSERVMRNLPSRRHRTAWPLWLGALAGSTVCWMSLAASPLLHTGWRDWLHGELSVPSVGLWLMMAAMAWLALAWSLAESRGH